MICFEINKKYYDDKRNCYTILNRKNDMIEVKFNQVTKKYRVVNIGGVESALCFGNILFKAGINKIKYNDEIDNNFIETVKINNGKEMGYYEAFKESKFGH